MLPGRAGDVTFKDHFSAHAESYAAARPRYPDSLFRFLAGVAPARELAWDCATGNGQAAVSLAAHFARVCATDASDTQIEAATQAPGVAYRVAPAESSGLEPACVDLITVAQALHWFDVEQFFAEAERVLKPGGVLAAWCYGTCTVDASCDRLVHGLYRELEPYWPPERRLVENAYRDIELPFPPLDCPAFSMSVSWTADEMLGYLKTWSATQRHLRATGSDATRSIAAGLRAAWGDGRRTVSWPLTVKAGRRPADAVPAAAR